MTVNSPPPPPPQPARTGTPTPTERWYLDCLIKWTASQGRPPTQQELANYTRKSRTSVYGALLSLEGKGYVRRRDPDRKFEVIR